MVRVSTWCVWVAAMLVLVSAPARWARAQEFDVAEIELPRPAFPLARVRFGRSISIEGNVVVVGFGGRVADDRSGGFVVYELVGTVPIERGVYYWPDEPALFVGDDGTGVESFGTEVALQGRSLVVTSPAEYDHHGAVYLYRRSTPTSTTFTYVQRKGVPDASGPSALRLLGRARDRRQRAARDLRRAVLVSYPKRSVSRHVQPRDLRACVGLHAPRLVVG
jgi:hypothetical protein